MWWKLGESRHLSQRGGLADRGYKSERAIDYIGSGWSSRSWEIVDRYKSKGFCINESCKNLGWKIVQKVEETQWWGIRVDSRKQSTKEGSSQF